MHDHTESQSFGNTLLRLQLLVLLLCLGSAIGVAPDSLDQSCEDAACRAERAATALLLKYQTPTSGQNEERGLFGNTLPWIEANGIETICDYVLQVGGLEAVSPALRTRVETMLVKGFNTTDGNGEHYGMGNCHTPFCGSFDDQAWWALAWAKAYELTAGEQYLHRSEEIFEYLRNNSWDERACGGGVWWSSTKTYKNSITNTLFFTLAASLATIHRSESGAAASKAEYFTEWAQKSWRWMDTGSGRELRRGGSGLFLDGLSTAQCNFSNGNDGGANVTWTYNQGVVLSGLGKLYELTGDDQLLHSADAIVDALLRHLTVAANTTGFAIHFSTEDAEPTVTRVLIEPGCGDDGCDEGSDHAMFKGATMRHLGYLRRTIGLPEDQQQRYWQFAATNAESCWWHARESTTRYRRVGSPVSDELFGNDWRGPWTEAVDDDGHPVAASQIAALALFSSLLPDGGAWPGKATPAAWTQNISCKIGDMMESFWKAGTTAKAVMTVALVLSVGTAFLATRLRRRKLGRLEENGAMYSDIKFDALTRHGIESTKGLGGNASETQPLLSNIRHPL